MSVSDVSQELTNELIHLDLDQKRRVLQFVRSLRVPAGTPGKSLTRFAGLIPQTALDEMAAAIEAGCEGVSQDDW